MIVQEVLATCARIAGNSLWPGFDPRAIPLAIYDGSLTWLTGFPHCPAGFVTSESEPALVHSGRHPAIRANSVADLDGILVATLLIDSDDQRSPAALAALALHEAFHVFQQRSYPGWIADEAELFMYPTDDPHLVALARQEDVCLERALRTADPRAWTAAFVQVRAIRFAAMPATAVRYERQTELTEGLAQYLEWQALGRSPEQIDWSGAPRDVRSRCYRTGAAIAHLLDRLVPQWQRQLTSDEDMSLDALLAAAPGVTSTRPATISLNDQAAIAVQAEQDVSAAITHRRQLREAFLSVVGLRLVIHAAPDQPLRVRGFDPVNVTLVGPGEVLHERYLELENEDGVLEIFDGRALTTAAGRHPLFDGVQSVVLAGLAAAPEIVETHDGLAVALPGCRLTIIDGEIDHTPGADMVWLGSRNQRPRAAVNSNVEQ